MLDLRHRLSARVECTSPGPVGYSAAKQGASLPDVTPTRGLIGDGVRRRCTLPWCPARAPAPRGRRAHPASALGGGLRRLRQQGQVRRPHHALPGAPRLRRRDLSRSTRAAPRCSAAAPIPTIAAAPSPRGRRHPRGARRTSLVRERCARRRRPASAAASSSRPASPRRATRARARQAELVGHRRAQTGIRLVGPELHGARSCPHHRLALCSSVVLDTDRLARRAHRPREPERRA